MLEKQGWKLITNSSSLLTRVLKAKYFPRSGFLDANIGHNPSYTWRIIQSTIPLLSLGYRWKIGDGNTIKAWTDPWIRSRNNMRPTTASHEHYADLRVSHLFDPISNTWNYALLNTLYNAQDVADICKIPLHSRASQDTIIWKASPNGMYSVKFAYHLCLNIVSHDSSLSVPSNWHKLWDMQIPPKLKHFCWRLLRGCLPTRFNLHNRGVPCQTVCALCSEAAEDELHLFTDCRHAILCWKEVNLWSRLEHQFHESGTFPSIVFSILLSLDEESLSLFVAVLWSIWRARNECIWENKQANHVTSCRVASDLIRDYNWVQNTVAATPMSNHDTVWKKPPATWLKCNVDGALFASEEKCGIGICFRDSSGSLVQGHTMVFPFEVTAAECEATALKHALILATAYGFERVQFESECQQVVNAINDCMYENELGTLLTTCRTILSSNASYNLAFIRRQVNRVAHNLARASLSQSIPIVHYYYPPTCISSIIIEEMI